MKMFAGVKSIYDIAKNASKYGYVLDRREFDEGKGVIELVGKKKIVRVLTRNGKFAVFVRGERVADERYFWLESKKWYSDLLDLLYEPLEKEKAANTTNVDDLKPLEYTQIPLEL